jgi:outer membrane protein OmpA-like peptidoglycan-associated protein
VSVITPKTLSGETVSKKRQWNRALPLAVAIGIAGTSLAQAQVVVGGRADVEIDSSVLDQLGPPSNLPQMLLNQGPVDTGTVTLLPPKALRASGKKKHHHLTARETAPLAESGTVHLHPVTHHAKTEHKSASKPAPEATPAKELPTASAMPPTLAAPPPPPAPTPAPAPAPVPAPTPAPVKAGPMALGPTPVSPPPASIPAPAPAPAPAASAQSAGTPLALTAQPSAPEGAQAVTAMENLSRISFDKDSARLPDGARDNLAHLASRMTEDATLEVQLLAYAAGDEENASKARRLSLSRALAVRSFLIDQGVRSTRIEVRALGNKVPDGSPDRVDIVGQKRG